MRNIFKYNLLGLALIMAGITACDTADQDVSPVISPDNKPVATFTPLASYGAINEGDTIVYNISIDKMIDRSITVSARVVGGTGDDHDILVTPGVIVPYSKSTSVTVIFPQDWDFEPSETIKLEFGVFGIADRYLLNPSTVNANIDLTIENFVSDTLTVSFDWSKEIDVINVLDVKVDVGTYNVILRDTLEVKDNAGLMDFDVFISGAAGFDINDPWSSNIVDAAATGDCPEVLKLVDLDDGEYILWTDLYGNNIQYPSGTKEFLGYVDSTQVAIGTAHFIRQGSELDWEMVQDSTQVPFIYSQGYDDDGTIFNGIIGKVIVAEGKYTVIDYVGTEMGPFKAMISRTPRPENIFKTRR